MTALQKISRLFKQIVAILVLVGVAAVFVIYYSYIFKKTVTGEIYGIDRVLQPTAILGGAATSSDVLFSSAIAVKDAKGEIFTASSTDRQWAVVKKGDCAEVIFYPYPPWELTKADTYFNARLKKLLVCDQTSKPSAN